MTKREFALLEACFNSEIKHALTQTATHLFQSKSKLMVKLRDQGLVVESTIVLGGRFPVTITGWELTALGHMTYCMTCPAPIHEGRP